MADSVSGKVKDLGVDRRGMNIELSNDPSEGPLNNVFTLKLDHANYNALYSLALAAAANRWTLGIRIEGDSQIDRNTQAFIRNMSVVWKDS